MDNNLVIALLFLEDNTSENTSTIYEITSLVYLKY